MLGFLQRVDEGNEGFAAAYAELLVDVTHVGAHGVLGNAQLIGNVSRAVAARQEKQDIGLARGEALLLGKGAAALREVGLAVKWLL